MSPTIDAAQVDSGQTRAATLADGPKTLGALLHLFSRQASARILLLALVLAGAARASLGALSWRDALAAGVVLLAWPLVEWLIHVFVLHARPFQLFGRTIDPLLPRSHRAHHADPFRIDLLFIPATSFLYSLPLAVGLAWLLTPDLATAATALVAIFALGLHYEWVHTLAHVPWVAPISRYRELVRRHRLHHFKSEQHWYGVSMVAADGPLGTAPDPDSIATSPNCRDLLAATPSP